MVRPLGRRWKRADVTPLVLCQTIRQHGVEALDTLAARGVPPGVLLAAVYRDTKRGYVTWGVSAWRPLLDWRGIELLRDLKAQPVVDTDGTIVHRDASNSGFTSHGVADRCSYCAPTGDPSVVDTGKTNPLGVWHVVAAYDNPATGATETQEVRGTSPVVAAWFRAVADQLEPPQRPTRPTHRGVAMLDPAGPHVLPRPAP